jgi:aspartate/methionine/tyrosine aminotransferase
VDFGAHETDRFVRFAYTRSMADIEEAARRIARFCARWRN